MTIENIGDEPGFVVPDFKGNIAFREFKNVPNVDLSGVDVDQVDQVMEMVETEIARRRASS
ncbi:hypothetical protein [Mycobacterium sp. DBP42]|uniref:hypothetical protein n=1 Tax=Mycobacteriaceae TaxID=1762 RepID=UPI00110CC01B|nr:hypothetical protein [Mycobacterium sp. DBP42]TMS45424.1 hypothetical protein E0T84_31070 [Mycobacterium sp. DBP42]